MKKHTIKNPNIDRTTPAAPEEEERQPMRRDGEQSELEDDLGGRTPELVPPGTVVEPDNDGDTDSGLEDQVGGRQPMTGAWTEDAGTASTQIDRQAVAADRATARTSDRTDARDGVDGSDAIGRDPDAVGGKAVQI